MQTAERSILLQALDQRLLSCHNNDAEVNITLLAEKLGHTREHLSQMLRKERISPALAWHLLHKFGCWKEGTGELKIKDLVLFVRVSD